MGNVIKSYLHRAPNEGPAGISEAEVEIDVGAPVGVDILRIGPAERMKISVHLAVVV